MHVSRFVNNPDETPLHSSGFGEVVAKDGVSTQNSSLFAQRPKTDADRKIVGGYYRSMLGNGIAPKSYERPGLRVPARKVEVKKSPDRQAFNSQNQGRAFSEPTSRSYNPYG